MLKSPISFKPHKGIGNSPLDENALSVCIDNSSVRGVAKINYKTSELHEENGAAASFSQPVKIFGDRLLCRGGELFRYVAGGNNWALIKDSNTVSTDFVVWKDYYIVFRDALRVDAISTGGTETNISTTARGEVAVSGSDNIVYFGYGNIVGTITEVTGSTFDPGNSSTYTINENALDLPSDETITTMVELGANILIGCSSGNIYLWDRVSSSFEMPTRAPEGVKMLIPINNLVYVVIANGDIYVTNGSSIEPVKEFPKHILNDIDDHTMDLFKYAYRISQRKIYIGYGSQSANGMSPSGVYSYDMLTGEFSMDHRCSNGSIGGSVNELLAVHAMQINPDDDFFIGWSYNSSFIIDSVNDKDLYSYAKYDNYQAYAISPIYRIGRANNKETLSQHCIYLANKLPGDCSVRLSYRTTRSGQWTAIGTQTGGNVESIYFKRSIEGLTQVQFMVEMSTSSGQTPEVLSVESI